MCKRTHAAYVYEWCMWWVAKWSGWMCVYARARAKDVDCENINIFEWQLHANNIEHSHILTNTLAKFNFPITLRQFISSKLNRVNVCLFVSTFFSLATSLFCFMLPKSYLYVRLPELGWPKLAEIGSNVWSVAIEFRYTEHVAVCRLWLPEKHNTTKSSI